MPTQPPKRLRVALYARVSTKDKGQNPDNQLGPLRERAKAKGWDVVREYIEHESASGKSRRTQFAEMLAGADKGHYDVLAFWSLDRFSREGVVQTLLDLRRLTEAGVLWVSLQDPIPDEEGPLRDMVIGIMAALAQLESRRRSERAKAAIARLKKEGKGLGRRVRRIDMKKLEHLKKQGFTNAGLARHFGVSRGTIISRVKELEDQELLDRQED